MIHVMNMNLNHKWILHKRKRKSSRISPEKKVLIDEYEFEIPHKEKKNRENFRSRRYLRKGKPNKSVAEEGNKHSTDFKKSSR